MQRSTLVVDDDEARRRNLVHALSRRGLRYLDVADAFGAMAALGRADFGAVIATEGRRTLSLRGLCQLARRRHPDVAIFIIHRDGSDPVAIPQILGTKVDVLAPAQSADDVAAAVESALLAPLAGDTSTDFNRLPQTVESLVDVDEDPTIKTAIAPTPPMTPLAPGSLSPDEPTEKLVRAATPRATLIPQLPRVPGQVAAPSPVGLPPLETHAAGPQPLLEGLLDGSTGPALLMGVFSQELTGRLVVKDGPAASTLYFYRGEPVWADDPLGDSGLHRRLVHKGRVKPDARLDVVAQGQLLGSLVQKGVLTGQQMHDFMRELVRDVVLSLSTAGSGAYRFEEDRKFLDVAPLLRVNPFGLVLESRRKSTSPAQLLALSGDIEGQYVVPGPGLGTASDKLSPFVRGARLSHVIDGSKTVRQVLEYTSLDQFMGTLVMVSLRDTKLVSFSKEPRAAAAGGVTLKDTSLTELGPEEVTLVDAEFPTEPPQSEEEAKKREAIFSLYMRLKPLTVPRQVLGVGLDADLSEIEAAYQARMKELDPAKIPEGSAQQLLTARVDELRRKVTSAYQALQLQVSAASGTDVNIDGTMKSKTNPF